MKNIKLNSSSFKKRSDLSKKNQLTYKDLVTKNNLEKKIETCLTFLDNNSYLHIKSI